MTRTPDTPLILLHGFTGSSGSWRDLLERLGERRPVLVPDLPGHGPGAVPSDLADYTVDAVASRIAASLDARGWKRAVVLGYSLGGRIALRFALAHPRRVAALVLESTSPGIDDPAERQARVRSDLALAESIEQEGVAAFVDRWELLPLWASQRRLAPPVRAALRAQRMASSATGLANSLRAAGAGVAEPVHDRLGEITAPVLVVAGALDTKYAALAAAMAAALPDARLVVVPDAGHAVHLERPDVFASLVAAFLDNFDADGRPPVPGRGGAAPEEMA